MQVIDGPVGSFACTQALDPYLRVKFDATYGLAVCGPEDVGLGTLKQRHIVSGLGASAQAAVVLNNAQGTRLMVAAGAFTVRDVLYGAEGGKVDDIPNNNPVGIALQTATADGDQVEVLPIARADVQDALPGILIEDDFTGDWDAAATALTATKWTKLETDGLGVTSVDAANGVLSFAADAVAEVAVESLFMENSPVDVDQNPIFYAIVDIEDKGDHSAVTFDFGLSSDDHATDFGAIACFVAFHVDGATLDLDVHSDDGTNDIAATDTLVNLVEGEWREFKIDCSDTADVKFYTRLLGTNAWTRLLSTTTFDISNYTGTLTPIFMAAKTSNDSTFDMRVDYVRVEAERLVA